MVKLNGMKFGLNHLSVRVHKAIHRLPLSGVGYISAAEPALKVNRTGALLVNTKSNTMPRKLLFRH